MTKAPRAKGTPIQLKDSRETLILKPTSVSEKRNAQLVVCEYVEAWFPHLDEAGRIAEARELMDILGISGR